jgi:hypothetical protein
VGESLDLSSIESCDKNGWRYAERPRSLLLLLVSLVSLIFFGQLCKKKVGMIGLLNRNLDVRKSGRDGKDDEGDFNMTFGSQ